MGMGSMRGVVRRIVAEKGFGFIRADGASQEYFFHRTACVDFETLREGDAVTFDVEASDRGPRAHHVERA